MKNFKRRHGTYNELFSAHVCILIQSEVCQEYLCANCAFDSRILSLLVYNEQDEFINRLFRKLNLTILFDGFDVDFNLHFVVPPLFPGTSVSGFLMVIGKYCNFWANLKILGNFPNIYIFLSNSL